MSHVVKLKLGPADRERYGAPEWLDLDLNMTMVSEAVELDDAGIDWEQLRDAPPAVDAGGKPVLDENGRPQRRVRAGMMRVWVWMALRRSGRRFPIGDIDFNMEELQVLPAAEPEPQPAPASGVSPGKGLRAAASARGSKAAGRSSITSTRGSRTKT